MVILKQRISAAAENVKHPDVEDPHRRALVIREKVLGPDHPSAAEVLEGRAKVCAQTGRAAEAQELAARAKAIREKSAGVAQAQASSPS